MNLRYIYTDEYGDDWYENGIGCQFSAGLGWSPNGNYCGECSDSDFCQTLYNSFSLNNYTKLEDLIVEGEIK